VVGALPRCDVDREGGSGSLGLVCGVGGLLSGEDGDCLRDHKRHLGTLVPWPVRHQYKCPANSCKYSTGCFLLTFRELQLCCRLVRCPVHVRQHDRGKPTCVVRDCLILFFLWRFNCVTARLSLQTTGEDPQYQMNMCGSCSRRLFVRSHAVSMHGAHSGGGLSGS